MITSKTYTLAQGANFISGSELAFATLYKVTRSGLGHDTTDPNRGYIHDEGAGKITFAIPGGEGGEKVHVVFDPGSGPAPPVCVPVTGDINPPAGVEDQLYLYQKTLSGTAPFVLTINNNPEGFLITVTGSMLRITKKYPSEGTHTIDITITNCNGGGLLNYSGSITIEAITEPNILVSNLVFGATVLGVQIDGAPMSLKPGDIIPIYPLSSASGFHTGFSLIVIKMADVLFGGTGTLYLNTVPIESIPLSNGNNIFTTPAVTADNIQIILN